MSLPHRPTVPDERVVASSDGEQVDEPFEVPAPERTNDEDAPVQPRTHQRRPSPMWTYRRGLLVRVCSIVVISAVLASGCSVFNREAAATWDPAPDQTLDANTTTFTALVERLGCNSGVTGEGDDPAIEVTDDQVVVTFTVSPGEPSSATCPSNAQVAAEVELPEALGDRDLVDGGSGVRHTP